MYLWITTFNALHLLECFVKRGCSLLETGVNSVVLLLVERIAGVAFFWRIDHQLNQALPDNRRAETNGDEFIDLVHNPLVEPHQFEIASSMTTLAHHSLTYTMQTGQFNVLVLLWILLLHLSQNALKAVEFANKDVSLVDLVRKYDKFFGSCEANDCSDVLFGERSASWIARINDCESTSVDTFGFGFRERRLQGAYICSPVLRLIQKIWYAVGVENCESCGI